MSDSTKPGQPEPAKPMLLENRIDSLEVRVSVLEAQQNWLHLEQLRAEVAGLRSAFDLIVLRDRAGGEC